MRLFAMAVSWMVQSLLAAFFAFVGFMKATAPMADLARYHAWVAGLPEPVARIVGVSEIACAIALVMPIMLRSRGSWAGWAAILLIVNQGIAIIFHAYRGDLAGALAQNLILIALLLLVVGIRSILRRKAVSGL
ncbi:DoxX family protein [Sphingobium sp. HBC34]|uniref:DoxX family protein n=1 Tax=Sphingobium cyanobacteriorum TaxID=3063954 RepID=A0ABT8ZGR2_9SPHN|nr:DoxX family protein [Sphingobium sp. HBC34]MDO7833730.1 DoxX family protein [Sphingobium sp. HBC34]